MSHYVGYVGEVIIKPEYRKDFGQFFHGKYHTVENEPLKGFARETIAGSPFGCLLRMSEWSHDNALKAWEGKYQTSYNKETGVFVYGVIDYNGPQKFFTELLGLTGATEVLITEESFTYTETHIMPDSVPNNEHYATYAYKGQAGKVRIKPEYREDFDYFFHGDYHLLKSELFRSFVEKNMTWSKFTGLEYWEHGDEKEEWRGKYKTSYNESDGRFVYGITFNKNFPGDLNDDFINYILPDLVETVISEDSWDEWTDDVTGED